MRVSYINGVYKGPSGQSVPTKATALRRGTVKRAQANGWRPDVQSEAAERVVSQLLDDGLERGRVEPTHIKGGKTRGKFRFPRNWKVGHAIKA